MERADELKERIRQQPLNDRLEESRRRIGDMCSKGRCPKMTIPVHHDDDDFYINTTLADAQATIAALQARVTELEARQHFGACAKCLTNAWRICKEGTPDAVEMKCSNGSTWWLCDYCLSKEQLTQCTAERDALKQINDTHMKTVMKLSHVVEQRTAELEAANHTASTHQALWREACDQRDNLQAELERVRGELAETKEVEVALSLKVAEYEIELNGDPQNFYGRGRTVGLRTLIKALPKVEGEIDVYTFKNTNQVVVTYKRGVIIGTLYGLDHAKPVAALYKHRQGMEG